MTKKRSPKSARTETTYRNQDVTRRLLGDVRARLKLTDAQFAWLKRQHKGWLVDLNTRLHKVESYLWGTGAKTKHGRA